LESKAYLYGELKQSLFKKVVEEINKLNLNLVNGSFLIDSLKQKFLSIIQFPLNEFGGSKGSQEPKLTTVIKLGSYSNLCGE